MGKVEQVKKTSSKGGLEKEMVPMKQETTKVVKKRRKEGTGQ